VKNYQGISLGLCNQKGGAAKTTTVAALAAIYAKRGLKILAVDNDPQGNLSLQFGIDAINEGTNGTISDLYRDTSKAKTSVIATRYETIDIIPASVEAAKTEILLPTRIGTDLILRTALEPLRVAHDLILLDSPPNLGKFVVNVINASDYFMIPVEARGR
jgi:chromosome partitioning protein